MKEFYFNDNGDGTDVSVTAATEQEALEVLCDWLGAEYVMEYITPLKD